MKAVILAGGLGTRISEESLLRPKPMVEIGNKPILWHIMKTYSTHGINDFVVCLGYKGYMIKEYFANYYLHMSDVTFDLSKNEMTVHQNNSESWRVTLVDTGDNTMTGGRLKRVGDYIKQDDAFCLTYGDGVSDVNIAELIKYHQQQKTWATVTTTQPIARFGVLDINDNRATGFREKPQGDDSWINAGFFVLSPKVLDLIKDDETVWEKEPLETLASSGQLAVFKHTGFWQPMDTLRDRNYLNDLWSEGKAPWKIW